MMDPGERALALDDHSATARLVYLALRTDGWSTIDEVSERAGLGRRTVAKAVEGLTADGWVDSRTRATSGRGRSPAEYQPTVRCDHCGDRYPLSGIGCHEPHCDDDTFTSYDVQDMDPEDLGLGGDDKPEPTGGLR